MAEQPLLRRRRGGKHGALRAFCSEGRLGVLQGLSTGREISGSKRVVQAERNEGVCCVNLNWVAFLGRQTRYWATVFAWGGSISWTCRSKETALFLHPDRQAQGIVTS